jgi:glutamate N-acetyltransferase/amino-acid N-acetyltransferase
MLAFVTTDARVEPSALARALGEAAQLTFNAITIDGDTSTNDTLVALASGASGVEASEGDGYAALVEGLTAVSRELALMIVRGGEGATKLVSIRVTGAATFAAARQAAKTIANSPLVKTAVHGGDPNWGRLVAAAGRSGVPFAIERARVEVGPVLLFSDGQPHDERAPEAAEYLKGTEIDVRVDMGTGGPAVATVWTCDLSAEYVRINGEYRT